MCYNFEDLLQNSPFQTKKHEPYNLQRTQCQMPEEDMKSYNKVYPELAYFFKVELAWDQGKKIIYESAMVPAPN